MSEPSQLPAIAASSISVILFTNARSTETGEALWAWRQYLNSLKRPCEILLVQEVRPDVGPAVLSEVATRSFPYDQSAGFRTALNDAIHAAQHPLVVFSTCDKQYQPADLERLLKVIDQVDLVVGYRVGQPIPPWRVLLDMFIAVFSRVVLGIPLQARACWLGSEGRARRWIARWIFGVRVVDPECPFRLARRALFQRVPIQSGGPFVQVEMLAKANHLTFLQAEEPVAWSPPTQPRSDAISFGSDAWLVFRAPDFGELSLLLGRAEPRERPG